ncbi:hypothetical protein KC343_g13254 [Hortaea werneckii]|nr:hypothetical protein KC338_g4742 [Hortaea werneckii]KAI7175659.1 hypothetical protein KC352_g24212 [Hortaea werneckii]KAI7560353.1 hypothetical protein KC317_g9779 [Hortaea werneckii]KAI7600920.1 hypothetical protein KC346_g13052 [Hortaea werneckii]KAI7606932.1 hypothetical protein KC343_g13254 [Hortaea werneckii]
MAFSTGILFPILSTTIYGFCLINETVLGTKAWLISPSNHEYHAVAVNQPSTLQLGIAYGISEPIVTAILLRIPLPPVAMLIPVQPLHYIGTRLVLARLSAKTIGALRWPEGNTGRRVPASTKDTAITTDELSEDQQKEVNCDAPADKRQARPVAFKLYTGIGTIDTVTLELGGVQPDLELSREAIASYYLFALLAVAVTNATLLLTFHSLSATSFWGDDESLPWVPLWFLLCGIFQIAASLSADRHVAECMGRTMVLGQKLWGKVRDWKHFRVQLSALAMLLVTRMVVRRAVGLDAWLAVPKGEMEFWFGGTRYAWIDALFRG